MSMIRFSIGKLRSFLVEERAVASIFFIACLPAILILAGLGIETSAAYSEQMVLQNSADAAALAGALYVQSSPANVPTFAKANAALNLPSDQNGTVLQTADVLNGIYSGGVFKSCGSGATTCSGGASPNAVRVLIRREQSNGNAYPISFLTLMGWDHWDLSAAAIGLGVGGNTCILALDTSSSDIHTLFGGTSANIKISGCQIADNTPSNKGDSVDVKSGATLNFDSLYMVSGYPCDPKCAGTLIVNSSTYSSNNSGPFANASILENQTAITDPFVKRTIPAATGTCDHSNFSTATTQTLNPGFYCSTGGNAALTVSQAAATTLVSAVSLGANGPTLTLKTAPSAALIGTTVSDTNHATAIPAGTTVLSINVAAKTVTLSQNALAGANGVRANDNIKFVPPSTVITLNPGVYILDGQGGGSCSGTVKPSTCLSGNLSITGGATVTGSGVTIVLTTSKGVGIDVGNINIDTSSTLSITSPSTSIVQNGVSYAVGGMALWQDPLAPKACTTCTGAGAPKFDGNGNLTATTTAGVNFISTGANTNIAGAIYLPSQAIVFSGGSGATSCTQFVAWDVVFQNSASFGYPKNCALASGTKPIGATTKLVL